MRPSNRWLPLFSTNFLGVFNNNFFQNLICFVAIGWSLQYKSSLIITLANGLLIIPYLFFSPLGGRLAKTKAKKKIMLYARIAEICIVLLAITGFILQNLYIVMIAIFIFGTASTLYSPAKYGLIRDIGGNEGVSFGTGTLEMLSFFGILLGTLAAAIVSDHFSNFLFSIIMIAVAFTSLFAISRLKVSESEPIKNTNDTLNPIKFFIKSFKLAGNVKGLNSIIFGLGSFWMIGSLIKMNLLKHCPDALGMSNTQTGIVMTASAIGIGLGSYIAGIISRGKVQLGLTPIGGIGMMTIFAIIFFLHPVGMLFTALIFATAFFCGIFMVPLSAYAQTSIEGRMQGNIIAYGNFIAFLLILIASGLFYIIVELFDSNAVFVALFLLTLINTLMMLNNVPEMRIKFKNLIGIK